MNRIASLVSLLLISAMVVAGCGAAATSSPTAGGTSSTNKPITIGYVSLDFTNANAAALYKDLQADAQPRGWTMTAIDTHGNVDEANAAIQTFVTKKVSAIITEVYSSTSLATGLAAAKQAGIPVISHGGGPADGMDAWFEGDGGNLLATRMIQDMGGKGTVLAFTYAPGRPNLLRQQALELLVAALPAPGITIDDQPVPYPGFLEPATAATAGWLAAHPAGSGPLAIWGSWDGPCYGAITALQQAHRTDVKVYGFNADPPTLVDIKAGTFTASVYFDLPSAAHSELNEIAAILASPTTWNPAALELPTVLVDQSNLAQFEQQYPAAVGSGS